MTDRDYTHYVILVDRTGSMVTIKTETESGIREYVKEQQALPGKATLSLYQFDAWHDRANEARTGRHAGSMTTQVEKIADFAHISGVPDYTLVPRGNTPLLDAVGMTVTETGEKLAALPEDRRPGVVIFVIATDGEENWSTEWTRERVKALIEQQERDYGWKFTYLGANVDAFAEAGAIGIAASSSLGYRASSGGTQSAWGSASRWSASTRSAGPGGQSVSYGRTERDDAMQDDPAKTSQKPPKKAK